MFTGFFRLAQAGLGRNKIGADDCKSTESVCVFMVPGTQPVSVPNLYGGTARYTSASAFPKCKKMDVAASWPRLTGCSARAPICSSRTTGRTEGGTWVTSESRAHLCPVAASHISIIWPSERNSVPEIPSLPGAVSLRTHHVERAPCSPATCYASQDGTFPAQFIAHRNECQLPGTTKREGGVKRRPIRIIHLPESLINAHSEA